MSNIIAWDDIQWTKVQNRVSKYQHRIYKASKEGNLDKVRGLQKRLVKSLDARLLAVRRVTTENKGRKTPGVDLKLYLTSKEKIQVVNKLRIDGKACPIRRILIPKPGKKEKRPLGIPVQKDRAKQTLLLFALEPEWEARFEPNSYGFRPGRSCHDAVEAIFKSTRVQSKINKVKYVLDADLKGCFDNISHEYLLNKLNTLPEFERQVKAWLNAGIFEGYLTPDEYGLVQPNYIGTPQGGAISPFLANVALHGMENHLKEWVTQYPSFAANRGSIAKKKSLAVIRYADDFVLIHPNKEILELAKVELQSWLRQTSGLAFNETKTKLTSMNQGFDFLGHHFINVNRNGKPRIKIYPSKKSVSNLHTKVRNIIQNNRNVSSYVLISKLRPVIIGWANYFRYCECKETFSKASHVIFQKLRAWVFRRSTRMGRLKLKAKYFPNGKTYSFD
jgi:RNA-directed DNA polymerase